MLNLSSLFSTFVSIVVPSSRYLQGYQREGVAFLWKIRAQGGGGILADDMGLGKTVILLFDVIYNSAYVMLLC